MCDTFETFINQCKTSWEPETFCISTYHVGNNFVGGLLKFFLIFMTSCENQEFWFGSVVFETNIINFLLKHQKSVIVKRELPYVRFSFTYFLLLKKWSYMLACYRHKAVSALEYYLLGGASSYTEEWMDTQGSLCFYNVLTTIVPRQSWIFLRTL